MQCFCEAGGRNRTAAMQNLLIPLVLTLLVLGASINVDDHLAQGSDAGPQGADRNSSSGIGSLHPEGDVQRGEGLYNASCVVCHASRATGGIGPRLAGNPVLSNEQAFWKTVYDGRHVMPPLKGALTEQQMADIKAWLKTLP